MAPSFHVVQGDLQIYHIVFHCPPQKKKLFFIVCWSPSFPTGIHAIELIKRAVNLLIKKVIFSLIVVALKMFSTTTTSVSMLISYDSQSWWFFLRSFWLDYYVCILSEKNPRKVKNSEQTGQAFTCWFSIITNLACFCYPYAFPLPMRSSKFSHVISYNV